MEQSRRQWIKESLRQTLALAAAGPVGNSLRAGGGLLTTLSAQPGAENQCQSAPQVPIVDTHQHLWDLSRLKLSWVRGSAKLNRNFTVADYLEATNGLGIEKAVYVEVAVDDSQLVDEAEIIIELCAKKIGPTVAAVIGGRPAAPEFPDYIRRFAGSPFVKGVRQLLPADQPDLWDRPEFIRAIQLLGQLGLCFELCMPPTRLDLAERLVARCPQTRFVLDHCGNADPVAFMSKARLRQLKIDRPPQHSVYEWRKGIDALARHPNVVCKISGIVARLPESQWFPEDLAPVVNNCFDAFGEDRVMFGSDWPVCLLGATLRQWVEALRQIVADRPTEFQQKLFCENAIRFYGLSRG